MLRIHCEWGKPINIRLNYVMHRGPAGPAWALTIIEHDDRIVYSTYRAPLALAEHSIWTRVDLNILMPMTPVEGAYAQGLAGLHLLVYGDALEFEQARLVMAWHWNNAVEFEPAVEPELDFRGIVSAWS